MCSYKGFPVCSVVPASHLSSRICNGELPGNGFFITRGMAEWKFLAANRVQCVGRHKHSYQGDRPEAWVVYAWFCSTDHSQITRSPIYDGSWNGIIWIIASFYPKKKPEMRRDTNKSYCYSIRKKEKKGTCIWYPHLAQGSPELIFQNVCVYTRGQ